MTTVVRIGLALTCCGLAACSAIIEPDVTRLGGDGGGTDGGSVMRDAGPEEDAGPEDDAGRMCPATCDDSVACTNDDCVDFSCVNEPDDNACGDGERCSPVLGCVSEVCTNDEECDDAQFCNGVERCMNGAPGTGCVDGDPIACPEDDEDCTTAFCDEDANACGVMLDDGMCEDGVSCTEDECVAGVGCTHVADDSVCEADFCTVNSICDASDGCTDGSRRTCDDGSPCTDDACDDGSAMCLNEPRDEDGDGFTIMAFSGPGGPPVSCGGTDCNDDDNNINPSRTEVCNRVDDNCDGRVDEGCPVTVPGDDCASPTVISLLTGITTATMTRAFTGLSDNYQTNTYCGASTGGRDAVFAVDLPMGIYDVTIETIGSVADTVLAVGFECSATAFNGVCNDDLDNTAGTASRIWVHRFGSNAGPSRFYVLVDAWGSTDTRNFTLNLTRRNVQPDACTGGGTNPLDISGGGAVVGFGTALTSGQTGSCTPFPDLNSEAVFRVRRATAGFVDFDVYSLDFVPNIYLRQAPCATGTEAGCATGAAIGGGFSQATLRRSVPTELHYLFVDGGRGAYAVYYEPF